MYITIWLVNISPYFYTINLQRDFSNRKTQLCQGRTQWWFFFQTQLQQVTVQEHFLVSFHSRPSTLVRAPPQMTLFPSPTTFHMCPFLSARPSTADPFARKTISNDLNTRSTSLIILSEEGVTIFNPHVRFSPLAISFGLEKLKPIILSYLSIPSPSKKRLKTK